MNWVEYIPTLVAIVIATVFALGGYLFSRSAAVWLRQRGALAQSVHSARRIISLLGLVLAGVVLYVAFGPLTLVSGLTASAIIGLVVALALQTTIANIIAGVILIRDGVLRLDDQIQISGMSGKVVQMGLITIWLRTQDGTVVVLSNSTLLNGPFLNRSVADRLKGEF